MFRRIRNRQKLKCQKKKKVRTVKVGTHIKNRDCIVGGAYRKRELWGV